MALHPFPRTRLTPLLAEAGLAPKQQRELFEHLAKPESYVSQVAELSITGSSLWAVATRDELGKPETLVLLAAAGATQEHRQRLADVNADIEDILTA